MMFGPTAVAVLSVLVLALTYHVYVPFPDYASDPGAKSVAAAIDKIQRLCVKVVDTIGIARDVDVIRFFDKMWTQLGAREKDPEVEVTTGTVEGVGILIHRPRGLKPDLLPGLIYFHGGGWVARSAESYRDFTTYLSKEAKAVVISVNYRLAPEHVFPAAFDDCTKVTEHVLLNAKKYGIARKQVGIAGDEVGGGLALSVAVKLADKYVDKSSNIRVVGLFNPALQAFDFNLPSHIKYASGPGPLWKDDVLDHYLYYLFGQKTRHIKDHFRDNLHTSPLLKQKQIRLFDIEYLPHSFRGVESPSPPPHTGNETMSNELRRLILDTRVSPMLMSAEEMDILPCTYFIVSEFDPLRDETFMLYAALRNTDLEKSEHLYYRSEQHGFLEQYRDNAVARDAIAKFIRYFRRIVRV